MKVGKVKRYKQSGYVMLEIIIAIGLFSAVTVSLMKALSMTNQAALTIQEEMTIQQVLNSAIIDVLSQQTIEEGESSVSLVELTGDDESFSVGEVETLIEEIELENETGNVLPNMFLVRVTFHWQQDNEWQERSIETWRHAKLYE